MALYQFISLALLVGQSTALADLEKRAEEMAKNRSWTPEVSAKRAQINADLKKMVDADSLKSADEFRRAAVIVQIERGAFQESRLQYELTITAMVLGDPGAATKIKSSWDQLLISTGRHQHLGSMKPFQTLQADKFALNPTAECVQTVLNDPIKARQDAAKLTPNPEIRKLVEEDQKVRQGDWSKLTQEQMIEISKADDARRTTLKALLKGIKLMTAQDYHDAALVMQHGSWFDDYALAHELSVCSAILDPKIGRQMVALSYDRMLDSAGYPQRVGTQYHGVILSPVDSAGFNDTMRRALGRKPLAEVPKKLGGG